MLHRAGHGVDADMKPQFIDSSGGRGSLTDMGRSELHVKLGVGKSRVSEDRACTSDLQAACETLPDDFTYGKPHHVGLRSQ